MTTSGTHQAFAPEFADLIDEAFERIGIAPSALNADMLASARRSVNIGLTALGLHHDLPWCVERTEQTLLDGQPVMVLAGGVVAVLAAALTTLGEVPRPLVPVGRSEVLEFPTAETGSPSVFAAWPVTAGHAVQVWPIPDLPTATTYRLTITLVRRPQDVTALMQSADAPVAWADAICADLARRLAEKFAPAREAEMAAKAAAALAEALIGSRDRCDAVLRVARR